MSKGGDDEPITESQACCGCCVAPRVHGRTSAPAVLALIFAFEGFASLRQHWYNLPLAATAALFLVLWPLTALAGVVLLALGRLRASVLATAGTAVGLIALWLASLALIVLVQ